MKTRNGWMAVEPEIQCCRWSRGEVNKARLCKLTSAIELAKEFNRYFRSVV